LSDLFTLPGEDDENKTGDRLPEVLRVVLSSPPFKADTTISPAWVQVLGDAMQAYKAFDSDACGREISKVWKAVWNFLDSNDVLARKAAARSLSILIQCFPSSLVAAAVADPQGSSTVPKIVSQISKALVNISYSRSMPELLAVISSLISGLRARKSRDSPTATEVLLLPLISQVGDLRTRKSFEFKEAADNTLGIAMQILGPETLLRVLPLNLEPEQR
jgi:ribosomal RNA-processing protein 12